MHEALLPATALGWAAVVGLGLAHVFGQGSIAWALGRLAGLHRLGDRAGAAGRRRRAGLLRLRRDADRAAGAGRRGGAGRHRHRPAGAGGAEASGRAGEADLGAFAIEDAREQRAVLVDRVLREREAARRAAGEGGGQSAGCRQAELDAAGRGLASEAGCSASVVDPGVEQPLQNGVANFSVRPKVSR